MKGNAEVVNTLNKLLAGELMATDQYLLHGEMYADMGLQKLAEHALHESEHERQHAKEIVQRMLFLEGEPDLATRHEMTTGSNVEEMLKNDLAIEYKVVGDLKAAVVKIGRAHV